MVDTEEAGEASEVMGKSSDPKEAQLTISPL
jgi:hypothetical protein